jgi:hypothetical protein
MIEGYTRNKLREEGRLNDQLELLLNSISFEELIVLKFELVAKNLPRYFSIKHNKSFIHDLLGFSLLYFVFTNNLSKVQACKFLGISAMDYDSAKAKFDDALDSSAKGCYTAKHEQATAKLQ